MSNELNELIAPLDNLEQQAATFLPGQIIGGRYKILSLLGRGGVGSVYLVEQVFLKQELALKVLDGKQILNDAQVRRFQMEAKAANSLNHPSLVMVHDFGVLENEQPYLVMEYIKGVNLTEFIKANGTLDPQLATLIFSQLSLGMAHAHKKSIIHRDIKPSNIMLSESMIPGTPGSAKIVDFGIAKLALDEGGEIQSLTRTGEIFGSPLYMSPEQCSGGTIDQRSDIYSFGCALFEALTGTPPHFGSNPLRTLMLHVSEPAPLLREASLGQQFPDALEKIVQKLLKKAPSERYQNFDDVANDLTAIYSQNVVPTQHSSEIKVAKESKAITITLKKASIYLALAMIASSAATIGIVQSSKFFVDSTKKSVPESAQQAPQAEAQKAPTVSLEPLPPDEVGEAIDVNFAAHKAFGNITKISSEIVTSGEHTGERKFDFPTLSLGSVSFGANRHPAIRTQYFPADIPLSLCTGGGDPAAFNHPEIFAKLNVNDFAGLKVAAPSTAQVEGTPVVSVEKEAANLAVILSTFAKSETLKMVLINQLPVNQKSVAALDSMRALRSLDLFLTSSVDLGAEKHSAFQRLSSLSLTKPQHSDLIIRQIEGSNNLNKLALLECKLSPDSLSPLRTCSNLNYLAIENDVYSDQWLKDLRQLHSLRTIYLNELTITSKQLQKILDSCPQLEKIILGGYTAKNLMQTGTFSSNPRVSVQNSRDWAEKLR